MNFNDKVKKHTPPTGGADIFSRYFAATGNSPENLDRFKGFLAQLAEAESYSGKAQSSDKSTASGYYHYLDDSTRTSDNRIKNLLNKHNVTDPDILNMVKEYKGVKAGDRPKELQDMMVLADLTASPTAPLNAWKEGKVSNEELYYKGHHTADPNAVSSQDKVYENWNNAGKRLGLQQPQPEVVPQVEQVIPSRSSFVTNQSKYGGIADNYDDKFDAATNYKEIVKRVNEYKHGGYTDDCDQCNNSYADGGKVDPPAELAPPTTDSVATAWGAINDSNTNYIKKLPDYKEITANDNTYTREQYLQDFHNNRDKISTYVTPDGDYKGAVTKNSKNCINGTTCALRDTTGLFKNKTYQGNLTFDDDALSMGFQTLKKSDYEKDGKLDLQEGDLMRFQMSPIMYGLSHSNAPTKHAPGQTYTSHTALYGGVEETGPNKGKHIYLNNSGNKGFKKQYLSDAELKKKLGPSGKHTGVNLTRYNPEAAQELITQKNNENKILSGDNEYAKEYEGRKLNLNIKGNEELGFNKIKNYSDTQDNVSQRQVSKIANIYSNNYEKLGKISNVPPNVLDKMIHSQIGIAGQETEYGNSSTFYGKSILPDKMTPKIKSAKDKFGKAWDRITGTTKKDWTDEVWNDPEIKKQYNNDKELFDKEVKSSQSSGSGVSKEVSKGIFQQKELSRRGRALGLNLDVSTHGPLASLALQMDNYHKLKKVHPDLSEDELVDLSILAHNQPSKAFNKVFVKYYLPKNDIDYANKVKTYRNRFVKGYEEEEEAAHPVHPTIRKRTAELSNLLQTNQKAKGGMINSKADGGPPWDIDYNLVRSSRQGTRPNADGTESTHLMTHQKHPDTGQWMAFPTLFQNKDKSWTELNVDDNVDVPGYSGPRGWYQAYDKAKSRGEVQYFNDENAAKRFAVDGDWKTTNQKAHGGPIGPPPENRKLDKQNLQEYLDEIKILKNNAHEQSPQYRDSLDLYSNSIEKLAKKVEDNAKDKVIYGSKKGIDKYHTDMLNDAMRGDFSKKGSYRGYDEAGSLWLRPGEIRKSNADIKPIATIRSGFGDPDDGWWGGKPNPAIDFHYPVYKKPTGKTFKYKDEKQALNVPGKQLGTTNPTFSKQELLSNPKPNRKGYDLTRDGAADYETRAQYRATHTRPNGELYPEAFTDEGTAYRNSLSHGGRITGEQEGHNAYNEGGLHEQNPHGGIPQGMGSNGKMNTVEEGETSAKLKQGKFIFSNRIQY